MINTFTVVLMVILGFCLYEAIKAYRKSSTLQNYFLHDGKLTTGPFVGTMVSTNISLGNFIYLCAIWGFLYGGSGVLWITIGIALMAISFLIFGPKFRTYVEDARNTGTLHEYLASSFFQPSLGATPLRLRMMASLATVITLLLALVLEMHLASTIVATLTGRPAWLLFLMLAGVASFYAAVGGYWGVVVTDIFQAIFLFIGLLAIPVFILLDGASTTAYQASYSISIGNVFGDVGWHNIASIVVFGVGWPLVTMDTWQRNCATRRFEIARSGVVISGVIMAIFAAGWGFAGIYDKLAISPLNLTGHSQGYDPISDILLLAPSAGPLAHIALGVLAAGLIMAAISTADTFFVVCGHSLVSDVIVGGLRKSDYQNLTPSHNAALTDMSRGLIVGFWVLAVIVWLVLKHLGVLASALSLFFAAYSIQYALLPAVLAARRAKPHSGPAFWSILVGLVVALICGFGSVLVLQYNPTLVILWSADKWLALTPVLSVALSALTFVVTMTASKEVSHE